MPLLTVEQLSASYGPLRVLHDISVAVEKGEVVALIGPNGAGKTTLLRAISRLVATTGRILFDGEDVSGFSPKRAVIAGIVQAPEGRKLFPDMTVSDNLQLGAYVRRDRADLRSDLEQIYDLFPVLRERRSQKAGTMSGGEQQMLAIGRALMARPRILLLDEPSFGIAPIVVDRIFAVIRRLNEQGLTALVVEQNASLALEVASRGYVLENGRIVLHGTGEELAANALVREAYLGM